MSASDTPMTDTGYPAMEYALRETQQQLTAARESIINLSGELTAANAKLAEAEELRDRLKMEAKIHAQEARTANHTIAEIYQVVTGATGEPGNWNGAEPVKAVIAWVNRQ